MKRNRNGTQPHATLPAGPTPAQMRAIEALAAGRSMTAAAQAAGCDRSTVWRWSQLDPEFIAALNAAREDIAKSTRADLRAPASDAVATIRRLVRSKTTPAAVRLQACVRVLEAVGAFAPPERIGLTDADEIRRERAKAEAEWERWSCLREHCAPAQFTIPYWRPELLDDPVAPTRSTPTGPSPGHAKRGRAADDDE